MDEQIKPVAWVDTDDLECLVADGEVCADMHNSRVGECFAPLYSQQSIDALRADYLRAEEIALNSIERRKEAEAEAESLRALCRDMLPVFEAARPLVLNLERLRDAARKGAE